DPRQRRQQIWLIFRVNTGDALQYSLDGCFIGVARGVNDLNFEPVLAPKVDDLATRDQVVQVIEQAADRWVRDQAFVHLDFPAGVARAEASGVAKRDGRAVPI